MVSKLIGILTLSNMVAADHQSFLNYELDAEARTPALSFSSNILEGMYISPEEIAENVAIRTFTSKHEEGGRGERRSKYFNTMPTFRSRGNDF